MAVSARIDELRSKFDENPRRYFAPLANEYRKAGDLGTAIAICRTQLRVFPSHMSGHVVLGQALFEAGELAEARTVFERAVELDAENLIALRHLGDIAHALGDEEAAHKWYRRVLDADPYNEQISALLDELSRPAAAAPAPEAPSLGTSAEPDRDRLSDVAPWPAPVELSTEPARDTAPPSAEPHSAEELEFIDFSADDFQWASAERTDVDVHETSSAPPRPAPEPPPSDVPGLSFDPVVGLDLVPSHDAALEQLEHATQPGEPLAAEAPAAESPAVEKPPVEKPAEPFIPEEGATLDLVTSETFATETMAELCLEQGHEEEALAIYERLVAQRPGDAELAERTRALRAHLHPELHPPETAGEFLRWLAQRDTTEDRAGASADRPAERETPEQIAGEQTEPEPVGAEPTEEPAASDAPAETARDAWAAGAWEGAFRPRGEPSPSLLDELRIVDDARSTPTDLSFDRFFAGEQGAAAPAEQPTPARENATAATESPSPASPTPESAASSEADDLAAFNAWLRGLRDS